jgi:hypothetical protein
LLVAILGAAGAYTRFTSPTLGLYLVMGGLAWMAFLFFPALVVWLKRRGGARAALLFGLLALGAAGAAGFFWFQNPLNDVTTNTAKPPLFLQPAYLFQPLEGREFLGKTAELNRDYPPGYAGKQNAHYADMEALPVQAPPAELGPVIEAAIKQRFPDWKIAFSDKASPHLEAEIENPWLHTVDDFVVEARESKQNPNLSRVEFRIRNRFPYGDLGLSATRMKEVRAALAPALRKAEQKWAEDQKQRMAIPIGGLPGSVSDKTALPVPSLPGTVSHEIPLERANE